MKAQLSLEFLIVFSVFLAVLLMAVTAISKVRAAADAETERQFDELALSDIANAADSACILGDGNRRVVQMPDYGIALSFSGKEIGASSGAWSGKKGTKCEISGDSISSEGGKIEIENRNSLLYFSYLSR